MSGDDSGQWTDEDSHELKRVKVYELIGSRWVDQGTAFCFGDFQDNEALLIARAEADFNHIILSTTIRTNDVYQRQQDTLIVWTEPDGVDYALSFQDPEGCAEVWHFIQQVQRHLNNRDEAGLSSSPLIGPEPSITTTSIIRSGHLPPPRLGIMGEIERAIKTLARTNAYKERICEYIQTEEYIKGMVEVMNQAEDLESLENLHALCSCMQAILMLNDHSLYEHILEDDIFFGVVGMLEYDPEFPTYKANYREFLHQTSRFHQPVPIRDEIIQKKVHHTYRLQFLKDVVLARAIDDSTFNVLNSSIIFNQIDIINHVQSDIVFLHEVISYFVDDEVATMLGFEPRSKDTLKDVDKMDVDSPEVKTNSAAYRNGIDNSSRSKPLPDEEVEHKREVVSLIQQLCVMGKNVQLPARMALFRTLVDRGVLFAVQWALAQPETGDNGRLMIATAGEILITLLDHDLNGVRGHVLRFIEAEKGNGKKAVEKETILELMCRIMVKSRELDVQSQVGEALRTLLEIQPDTPDAHPAVGMKMLQRAKDDPGTERFMEYFYKHCAEILFRPLSDLPDYKTVTDSPISFSREKANLYLYLCDLLSSFTVQHSFRSHFFILSSNHAPRIASLLSTRDKHLRLAAFRFFRACLRLNNINIFKHLIKHDVFQPILDLTISESRRDNLLSASCQEFFEHIRKDNLKDLIEHCMIRHEAKIKALAETHLGGPRFHNFIRRWEMNIAPPPEEEEKIEKPIPHSVRRWGQGRLLETEEEDYFNADDDEEFSPVISSPPTRGIGLKRKRMRGGSLPGRVSRPPMPLQPLSALVAYDDGDDLGGLGPVEDSAPTPSPLPRAHPMSTGYFSSDRPPHDIPASPRISHKQILSKTTPSEPANEDDLLDQLFKASEAGRPPDLAGAKRRREDDDDELLERLASRAKRPSVGPSPERGKENAESPVTAKAAPARSAEEGPKKIKLKFGAVGAAVASATSPSAPASPSNPGIKEGDNG
ncbi:uncharacterized protein FIBRA_05488 [Fibroporia radiculosa]|uniref:Uncharacterized protein n=1 Tax=Fibroporia radiculosa TaxID=599839 RepID=J4H3J2_9APHY|nr:uncharacterized protein FIBRA_05488 [Fibroporia radiculosa]CCM03359.1 predicted protein [Fibroporia radiculosa]